MSEPTRLTHSYTVASDISAGEPVRIERKRGSLVASPVTFDDYWHGVAAYNALEGEMVAVTLRECIHPAPEHPRS